jgi:hypothetical protein
VKVITLSSWAGRCFDIAHGSLVDMPDEVALVRIDAGIVREATAEDIDTLEVTPYPGMVTAKLATVERPTLRLPTKGKR